MRQEKQITETKYFNALKSAKNDIELNNFIPTNWESNFKLSARTMATLRNLGIIKNLGTRRNSHYEWNNKIPVTMLLAKKVISENNNRQNAYIENRILNKLQEPIVKTIAKRTPKQILPLVDKTKIDRFTKQIAKPIQVTNQVGLIRRFFRWIY